MSIQTKLQTTERMTGASYMSLQSAVSSFEGFKSQVQALNMKKLTAKEKTQLTGKIKKAQESLAKAFSEQLGSINSQLTTAEREHKLKTTPSSTDFNYLPLLAGKNTTQLLEMGRSSTTAAKLLAAEGAMFGLSPELTNSMSKAASPETFKEIDRLDVEAVRLEQLRDDSLREVNQWGMKYQVDTQTEAQAAFLGDAGDSGGEL
jgi:hypothetical protein